MYTTFYSLQTLTKKKGVKEVSEKTVSYVHSSPSEMVRRTERDTKKGDKKIRECKFCGFDYPHKDNKTCPAKGKTCLNCQEENHFAKKCPKPKRDKPGSSSQDKKSGAQPQRESKNKGGSTKKSKQRFVKKVEEEQENDPEATAPPPPYEDYESDGSFTK